MARGVVPLGSLVLLVALAAPACDVRPLTARELYGAGGGAGADASVDASAAPDAVATPDGTPAPDVGGTDTPPVDATPEAPASACGQACAGDQFCNEATGKCTSSTGVGILSGQVVDDCSGMTIAAIVGIANKRQCSIAGKGSYFFTQLPFGELWLAAQKPGYQSYGGVVDIVPGGVIKEIRLERVGGCDAAAPDPGGCTCTGPTCLP